MGSYGGSLERESERFRLPDGARERFHRRRRRHERNQRVFAGVVALGIVGGGTWLAVNALRGDGPTVRPADQPRITATYQVGGQLGPIAAGNGAVWIADTAAGTVRRLDPETGGVVAEIRLDEDAGPPVGLEIAGDSLWVHTGYAEGSRSFAHRIDTTTNRISGTVLLGPEEHTAFTTHTPSTTGAGLIWTVNAATGTVTGRTAEGLIAQKVDGPAPAIGLSFGARSVWALGGGRPSVTPPVPGSLSRIDPRTGRVASETEVGVGPRAVLFGLGSAWVANGIDGTVSRIDAATQEVATIPLDAAPDSLAVDGEALWVLDSAFGVLLRLDPATNEVSARLKLPNGGVGLAAGAGSIWVTSLNGTVTRVEA